MPDDPHALKLYIDGNCYRNPGGAGAIACVAQYPDDWNRADEVVFEEGFHETTNNRMELKACICAHEYVVKHGSSLGVQRVLIVTDSLYVFNNFNRAALWRANKWKNSAGRPMENSDLWKRLLSARQNVRVRTEIIWKKGKKSPTLKMVDRAAKTAGKSPQHVDRGFRTGKVARSKSAEKSSSMFVPRGRDECIRVYRSSMLRKTAHKITFDLYDDATRSYVSKCYAYTEPSLAADLHRQHCYRVKFNQEAGNPVILGIIQEVQCNSLEISTPAALSPNEQQS